jgi:hypothetical protein
MAVAKEPIEVQVAEKSTGAEKVAPLSVLTDTLTVSVPPKASAYATAMGWTKVPPSEYRLTVTVR